MADPTPFLDRLAEALADAVDLSSGDLAVPGEDALLDLARIVAHGTERKNAPLATFLAGQYVAVRAADDIAADAAVDEVLKLARDLLEEE